MLYGIVAVVCVVAMIYSFFMFTPSPGKVLAAKQEVSESQILGVLQSQAQIASTEVVIRKMGIYDSDKDVVSFDPKTWKIGHRLCVVPVDIRIKYGINLNAMSVDDIKRIDSTTVSIKLPEPTVIDKSFDPKTDRKEIVTLATGARDNIGEETIQKVKSMAFDDVVNKKESELYSKLSVNIDKNTKEVFRSLLKGMGLNVVFEN